MTLDKRRFSLVLAALALAFAPHVPRLPVPFSLIVVLGWGYSLGMQHQGWPVPPRWLRVALALGCTALIPAVYGRSFGRDAGVALLCLMLGLKPVESRAVRDLLAMVFLSYFVIVTNVLYAQTLVMTLYMLLAVLAVTGALVHLHSGAERLAPDLRRGAVLLLQALPLALLLFVFFPRLQGALWGMQDRRDEAVSGFSETVSPGSVAELALNDDVAFRVDFQDEIPARDTLYWRGQVLDRFDGENWSRSRAVTPVQVPPAAVSGGIAYALTMEPHGQAWVFALDLPARAPRGTIMGTDRIVTSLRTLSGRVRFDLVSRPGSGDTVLPGNGWTDLPAGNPRARALARDWVRAGRTPRDMVGAMLDLFRSGYIYTLAPGRLDGDSVDGFLFGTRQGFCEHFASATAFVLRAAGVPTRLVVGYQGGEVNPVGRYLIVRQSDAHAWVEVWLDGQWTRLDPTSVVAPVRIATGGGAAARQEAGAEEEPLLLRIGHGFRLGWDAANNSWNQWVLGFSHERQRGLWERLGLDPQTRDGALALALILAASLAVVAGAVGVLMLRGATRQQDPVMRLHRRFRVWMEKNGVQQVAGEGPMDYLRRIEAVRPDLASGARMVMDEYVALRYRNCGDVRELERLTGACMRRRT